MRPIDTGSPDLAAALIEMEHKLVLVISVYIPHKTSRTDSQLPQSLNFIHSIIEETRRNQRNQMKLIVAENFNRHDQL